MSEVLGCLAGGLLLSSWLMPVHFLPWTSWHNEALAFGAILGWGGLLIGGAARQRLVYGIDVPPAVCPFFLVGALAAIHVVAGQNGYLGDALVIAYYIALCIASMVIGSSLSADLGQIPTGRSLRFFPSSLASVLILGGVLSAWVAGVQVFALFENSEWIFRASDLRRSGGNMAQPNHLATLLVMAMASLVHLFASRCLGGWAAALLWGLLSAGLAMTESRAGLLGLGVLLLWWLAKGAALTPGLSRWGGVAAVVCSALMFAAWPSVFEVVYLLGEGQVQGRLAEGSGRWAVWPQLVEAVLMRPWWGWGAGNVAEAHNAVAHAYAVSEPYTYSHNLVLDLALWFGIPAALGLVGVTGLWLWRRMRVANDAVTWYALALILPVGVHAMFEFPHAYAYFLVPVMLALGVLEGRLGGRPLCRVGIRPAAGLLLASTVLLLWSAIEYLRIEEDFRVARFEAMRIGQAPEGHERPPVRLLTQLGALVDSTRLEPRPAMPAADLDILRRVALRYPWVATQYRYALALALNGQGEEAARQLQVLRAQRGERIYRQLRGQLERKLDEQHVARDSLRLP